MTCSATAATTTSSSLDCLPAMPDSLPSDHPSISTYRVALARHGRTDRPRIDLPDDEAFPVGDVVRLVIDGREHRARIDSDFEETPVLTGAYDSPREARSPAAGTNRLAEWVEDAGIEWGGSVLVDVVEPGFKFGLRAPGERAVYEATEPPKDSLADIARRLEDDGQSATDDG